MTELSFEVQLINNNLIEDFQDKLVEFVESKDLFVGGGGLNYCIFTIDSKIDISKLQKELKFFLKTYLNKIKSAKYTQYDEELNHLISRDKIFY